MKYQVPDNEYTLYPLRELFRCYVCKLYVEEIHVMDYFGDWGVCHDCYAMSQMLQKIKSKHR